MRKYQVIFKGRSACSINGDTMIKVHVKADCIQHAMEVVRTKWLDCINRM